MLSLARFGISLKKFLIFAFFITLIEFIHESYLKMQQTLAPSFAFISDILKSCSIPIFLRTKP